MHCGKNFPFCLFAQRETLCGRHFSLLGNAVEFLDPVFSSGITIAMHSAKLVADLLAHQLKGDVVDWWREFVEPLMTGVDTFRLKAPAETVGMQTCG